MASSSVVTVKDKLTVFDVYDIGKNWDDLVALLRRFHLISEDGKVAKVTTTADDGTVRTTVVWSGKRCGERNCRQPMLLSHHTDREAEFKCVKCKNRVSPFSGTFFENVHLPVAKQLLLAACFVSRSTYSWIHEQLQIAEHTTVDHLVFCREICMKTVCRETANNQIGGPGVFVEIDESKFNKRKYNRGAKKVNDAWVFGAIERGDPSKIVMEVVEQRDAATLMPIILKHVAPGSIIISDCWKAYSSLAAEGYDHRTVNHSVEFVSPTDPSAHTNSIEGTWFHAKRAMPKQGLVGQYMDLYLCEFLWRRLRRDSDDLFAAFLQDAANVYPSA